MKVCPICETAFTIPQRPLPGAITDYSVSRETFNIMQCRSCELLHTLIKDGKEISDYYISNDYASHRIRILNPVHILYALARKFTLRNKRQLLEKIATGKSILDYGCGTGEFLEVMKRTGWKTTGYEPSQEAAKQAALKGIDKMTEDRTEIEENLSIITLWHVLEHTENPLETINFLKQKINSSGKIVVGVPNYKSYDALKYREYWAGYDVPRHLWHFSQKSIDTIAHKAGLKVIGTVPMKLDAYYVSLLSEKYLNKNRQTIFTYLHAILNGYASNRRASSTGEYSSMIYILSK